jgi:hypothetical protein
VLLVHRLGVVTFVMISGGWGFVGDASGTVMKVMTALTNIFKEEFSRHHFDDQSIHVKWFPLV